MEGGLKRRCGRISRNAIGRPAIGSLRIQRGGEEEIGAFSGSQLREVNRTLPRERGGTKYPLPEGEICYEAGMLSSAAAEETRLAAWAPLVGGRRSTKVLPLPSSLNSSLS